MHIRSTYYQKKYLYRLHVNTECPMKKSPVPLVCRKRRLNVEIAKYWGRVSHRGGSWNLRTCHLGCGRIFLVWAYVLIFYVSAGLRSAYEERKRQSSKGQHFAALRRQWWRHQMSKTLSSVNCYRNTDTRSSAYIERYDLTNMHQRHLCKGNQCEKFGNLQANLYY